MTNRENWEAMNLGFTAIPVLICGIIIILFSLFKFFKIIQRNDLSGKYLNAIWILGLLAFLFRVLELLIHLSDMFYALSKAKEPDFSAFCNGLSGAMLYSINGLAVLIISLIFWGLIKAMLTFKKQKVIRD